MIDSPNGEGEKIYIIHYETSTNHLLFIGINDHDSAI